MFIESFQNGNSVSCRSRLDSFGGKRDTPNNIKVFVWGLNDKDQLGGLKGSKIKLPVFSETLSHLKPICIAGGSKSLFVVTQVRILEYVENNYNCNLKHVGMIKKCAFC